VQSLTDRGVEFLTIPEAYYDNLQKGLDQAGIHVSEDMSEIKRLNILVDYDNKGYLLQIFTKPVEDRPTLFFEII
jgi:4-hydroxyphenylpyruvate dioxygenase